jgi:hypothetical protein
MESDITPRTFFLITFSSADSSSQNHFVTPASPPPTAVAPSADAVPVVATVAAVEVVATGDGAVGVSAVPMLVLLTVRALSPGRTDVGAERVVAGSRLPTLAPKSSSLVESSKGYLIIRGAPRTGLTQ